MGERPVHGVTVSQSDSMGLTCTTSVEVARVPVAVMVTATGPDGVQPDGALLTRHENARLVGFAVIPGVLVAADKTPAIRAAALSVVKIALRIRLPIGWRGEEL
jgi:hypothetical protein